MLLQRRLSFGYDKNYQFGMRYTMARSTSGIRQNSTSEISRLRNRTHRYNNFDVYLRVYSELSDTFHYHHLVSTCLHGALLLKIFSYKNSSITSIFIFQRSSADIKHKTKIIIITIVPLGIK